jgi:uncharacterized protein
MMSAAFRPLVALLCGSLFGFGLALSGMLDPTRVRGFLDVFGHWDPSLIFVLGGAVGASFLGVRMSRLRAQPLLAKSYDLPSSSQIDAKLVAGALIFGLGWGLSGLCPGPAVAGLVLGIQPIIAFVIAMLVGMGVYSTFEGFLSGRWSPKVLQSDAKH